jgi:hypothetical protein
MGFCPTFIFRFFSVRQRVMGTKLTANLDNFIFNIEHATAFKARTPKQRKTWHRRDGDEGPFIP